MRWYSVVIRQAAATREVQPLPPPPKWVPRGPASLGSLVASPVKGGAQPSGSSGSYRRGSASFRSSRANSVNSAAGSGPDSDGFGEFMGPDDLRTAIAGARADVAVQRGGDGSFTRCSRRRSRVSILSSYRLSHFASGKARLASTRCQMSCSRSKTPAQGFILQLPLSLSPCQKRALQRNHLTMPPCRAAGSAGRG